MYSVQMEKGLWLFDNRFNQVCIVVGGQVQDGSVTIVQTDVVGWVVSASLIHIYQNRGLVLFSFGVATSQNSQRGGKNIHKIKFSLLSKKPQYTTRKFDKVWLWPCGRNIFVRIRIGLSRNTMHTGLPWLPGSFSPQNSGNIPNKKSNDYLAKEQNVGLFVMFCENVDKIGKAHNTPAWPVSGLQTRWVSRGQTKRQHEERAAPSSVSGCESHLSHFS